jgi:hypothetical protein
VLKKGVFHLFNRLTKPGKEPSRQILWKFLITLGAFVIYLILFVLVLKQGGKGYGYFVLIPLITVSFIYGLKGGMILGLLSHPLNQLLFYFITHSISWENFKGMKLTAWGAAFVVGVSIGYMRDLNRRYKQTLEKLEKTNTELNKALKDVQVLSGLIPICVNCKKIRDDEGFWQQVEDFIRERSGAEFSHGLCPDCAKQLYPEVFKS